VPEKESADSGFKAD